MASCFPELMLGPIQIQEKLVHLLPLVEDLLLWNLRNWNTDLSKSDWLWRNLRFSGFDWLTGWIKLRFDELAEILVKKIGLVKSTIKTDDCYKPKREVLHLTVWTVTHDLWRHSVAHKKILSSCPTSFKMW